MKRLGLRRHLIVCSGLWLVRETYPTRAWAAETRVDADFTAQFYDVVSPYQEPVVQRRRYTHTLGLDASDLDGNRGYLAPELSLRARMRLDADLGQTNAERDPEQLDRYVPGLEEAPVDLMYAYLEGRHYLGGILGFRLGRQYQMDSLGFWSFDGGLVRLDAPRVVGVELYGGFEQRGGLPMLATSRYEADGVFRGDRSDLEDNQWSGYLEQTQLAPAYGISLQSLGLGLFRGRLSYRKVINQDRVLVSPFPESDTEIGFVDGARTSTERAGLSLMLAPMELGNLSSDLVYDVYLRRISDARASLDWYATEQSTLGAGYEYYLPSFDGDSIFNWFVQGASQSVELRGSTLLTQRLDVGARAGLRWYQADADAGFESDDGPLLDQVLSLNGRYRLPEARIGVDAESQWGETGHRLGGSVSGNRSFQDGYYDALVVLSLYDFSDALRPQRDATSFAYVLGGGVSPGVASVLSSRLGLEWEHAMNRLYGNRFRVLMTLQVVLLP